MYTETVSHKTHLLAAIDDTHTKMPVDPSNNISSTQDFFFCLFSSFGENLWNAINKIFDDASERKGERSYRF